MKDMNDMKAFLQNVLSTVLIKSDFIKNTRIATKTLPGTLHFLHILHNLHILHGDINDNSI
jgi:hypothetical protein